MTASRFPIEAGHIMMFARAIGDFNPVYHDAAYARDSGAGGIIAPPTFVQASAQYDADYPLRPHPGVPWFGSGATPSGRVTSAAPTSPTSDFDSKSSRGTGLHAEQHYEYHRPVRAGETLTLAVRTGKSWEKQGRRGGLLHFQESIVEYRGEKGELVITARSVGVRTEQIVTD
jgi:acyl dehydratase